MGYKLNESQEVFQLFKAIYFSKTGLYYSELIKLSGKKKNNITNQLKPLKDKGLIVRTWDKEKKDYLFTIDFLRLFEFLTEKKFYKYVKEVGRDIANKTFEDWKKYEHSSPEFRKDIYVCINFKQYRFLKNSGNVPINSKSDLKLLFPKK